MVHGSIVISREALLDVGGYNERYREVADLDLYDRLLSKYLSANIPNQLIGIRRHSNQGSQSITAYDEVIEICTRRLKVGDYSRKEISIIRSTLSRAYLFHSRFGGRDHGYLEQLKDLLRAIRVSPSTIVWNFCLVFLFNRFSDSFQAPLRRLLSGFKPKLLTGR